MISAHLCIFLLSLCCILDIHSAPVQSSSTAHNFIIPLESKVNNTTTAHQAFTQLIHSAPFVVVKFFSPGCGPCATMKTRFSQLAQEFHDRATFVDVNFKLFSTLAQEYKVQSVPTLVYFVNGVEKGRVIGAVTPAVLREKVAHYFTPRVVPTETIDTTAPAA
jgi:thioredoxin 1